MDAAARLVDECAAAVAEASARVLAEPGNFEARMRLEDAEQLHYLARHELRIAHRTARRRQRLDALLGRWTLIPWPARPRRR